MIDRLFLQMKKLIRQQLLDEKKKLGVFDKSEPKHIEYGLGKNALIMKVERRTIMGWRNQKYGDFLLFQIPMPISIK